MPAALSGPVAAMRRLAERSLLLAHQPMPEHVVMGSQTEADGRRLSDDHFKPPTSVLCSVWSKRNLVATVDVKVHASARVHAAQHVLIIRRKKHVRRVWHIMMRRVRCTFLALCGGQDTKGDL